MRLVTISLPFLCRWPQDACGAGVWRYPCRCVREHPTDTTRQGAASTQDGEHCCNSLWREWSESGHAGTVEERVWPLSSAWTPETSPVLRNFEFNFEWYVYNIYYIYTVKWLWSIKMAEEPLSVAKLPSPKPSSGKDHTMSQHHAWGATLRPKTLYMFNCSRLCTNKSYVCACLLFSWADHWQRRSCTTALDTYVRTVHTEWTNYTATYITVHNHKNIFEGVPSVVTYTTHKVLSQPSGSHVFQAYMSSLSSTMVSQYRHPSWRS